MKGRAIVTTNYLDSRDPAGRRAAGVIAPRGCDYDTYCDTYCDNLSYRQRIGGIRVSAERIGSYPAAGG